MGNIGLNIERATDFRVNLSTHPDFELVRIIPHGFGPNANPVRVLSVAIAV